MLLGTLDPDAEDGAYEECELYTDCDEAWDRATELGHVASSQEPSSQEPSSQGTEE